MAKDISEKIDEVLELFSLEVQSWDIGMPTFKTLTKDEAKQAILALIEEAEVEARIDELTNVWKGFIAHATERYGVSATA